jgi:TatD DNase family protein
MAHSQQEQPFTLIDTYCHLNLIVKQMFNELLTNEHITHAGMVVENAHRNHVYQIINVGTSFIETHNCITLAQKYNGLYAVAGIHPNDLTADWQKEFAELEQLIIKNKSVIVGIGETGIDKYRPGYDLQRQLDAFCAHIESALTHDLAIVVHTRTAPDETLNVLQKYKNETLRGVIHCYPYDSAWAQEAINLQYVLGIGGPITYPKNILFQELIQKIDLAALVLETDAPYLSPQSMRGKPNSPAHISEVARMIAYLKNISLEEVARVTTQTARTIFRLPII